MIHQLKSVVGFQEGQEENDRGHVGSSSEADMDSAKDVSKAKIEELGLSSRISGALADAGIKSAAGLTRKTASALKELDGIGDKAVTEIEEALATLGLSLKGE
jgi:DNA-directed RNA polymerase alpha subunit